MGSSSPKNEQIYDPIRKKWVQKTPEELIRQRLICQMVENLGYPKALIAVEKEFAHLPNLTRISRIPSKKCEKYGLASTSTVLSQIPKRRADIIVFVKKNDGLLAPALLVECKALPMLPAFARQVIGYNAFVGADFVVIANQTEVLTGSFDKTAGLYTFKPGLPYYIQLAQSIG